MVADYDGRTPCSICERPLNDLSAMTFRNGIRLCTSCIIQAGFALHGSDYFVSLVQHEARNLRPEPAYRKVVIPPKVRREVIERDGFRCRYCGCVVDVPQFDHVVPESRGGEATTDNLVVSCKPCNSRKVNRTPAEAGMMLLPVPEAGVK